MWIACNAATRLECGPGCDEHCDSVTNNDDTHPRWMTYVTSVAKLGTESKISIRC